MSDQPADKLYPTLTEILSEHPETQVVNLTAQIAEEEFETILADSASRSYGEWFFLASKRRQLMRYAMKRVQRIYVVTESDPAHLSRYTLAFVQRLAIREVLQQGMRAIAGAHFTSPEPASYLTTDVLAGFTPPD